MSYTRTKPPIAEPVDQLRARIPGWGVDRDPHDRPSVPRLLAPDHPTGAHWDVPDQQPDPGGREKSIEHAFLTPAFGTSCPTKGLSGVIRRFSYRRFSEARTEHWLLLAFADRVDAFEEHVRSLATLRPDNPITQTGITAELRYGGWSSRRTGKRADLLIHAMDPIIVAGPWIVSALVLRRTLKAVARGFRRANA
ncbi:MAG TPA: hypothetical protein VE487_17575 [Ilumatobacter sp.]|jgi:hypothetical protein|nr:hypothetical protein [Ilumatobacter sp.]